MGIHHQKTGKLHQVPGQYKNSFEFSTPKVHEFDMLELILPYPDMLFSMVITVQVYALIQTRGKAKQDFFRGFIEIAHSKLRTWPIQLDIQIRHIWKPLSDLF